MDGSRTQFFFRPFGHAAIFRLKTVKAVQFLPQKSCTLVGLVILSPEGKYSNKCKNTDLDKIRLNCPRERQAILEMKGPVSMF